MAAGTGADFTIYNDEFYGGLIEGYAQNLDALNSNSNGAIQLSTKLLKGDYQKSSWIDRISSPISRRDVTSVSAAADTKMTDSEMASVKVNRKIGPIGQTLDAWKKIGQSTSEMSRVLGQMIAQEKIADFVNTAIKCVEAGIEGQSNVVYDATGQTTKTTTTANLVEALRLFGDAANDIVCWVMHSGAYYDLMAEQIATSGIYLDTVGGAIIQGAAPGTLGRPVVVTDCSSLIDLNGSATDTYNVLGLAPGAVKIEESEQSEMVTDVVTGLENLVFRVQGEYAFNASLRGMAYDYSTGGANPTDATLATTTNWDKVVASDKHLPGIRLKANKA